jgi:hypothetical protein
MTFVGSDTLSYLRGRHSLKFGAEYRWFNNRNFGSSPGTFAYATVADFQAGIGNNFTVQLGRTESDIVQQALGLFAQDNVRVTNRLTLELGFRYEMNRAPTETDDRFVYFDPATVSLQRVNDGGRDTIYPNRANYQPRVGVLWDPAGDGRSTVRAAYAMLADQPVTNLVTGTASNPPLVTNLVFSGAIRLNNALAVAGPAGLAPNTVSDSFRNPIVHSWNLNYQRELRPGLGVQIGYVGSKGEHLRVSRNLNQLANGVRPYPRLSTGSAILPGSALGNITEVTSLGRSRYNALWISANQRLKAGLQFNGSYTLSRSRDTNSLNSQGVVVQDSTNIEGDWGLSDFDARHRYVFSAIWALPFSGNAFVRGWQIAMTTQGQSGNPVNIVTNIGTITGVANTVRPDLIGTIDTLGEVNQWFNNTVCDPRIAGSCTSSSVFALPYSPSGVPHLGNLGRNVVIGPKFFNTDLSVTKKTEVGPTNVEFRVEAFNLLGNKNFGQPGRFALPGSTAFGVITNTRFAPGDSGSSRQVQLAVKVSF